MFSFSICLPYWKKSRLSKYPCMVPSTENRNVWKATLTPILFLWKWNVKSNLLMLLKSKVKQQRRYCVEEALWSRHQESGKRSSHAGSSTDNWCFLLQASTFHLKQEKVETDGHFVPSRWNSELSALPHLSRNRWIVNQIDLQTEKGSKIFSETNRENNLFCRAKLR